MADRTVFPGRIEGLEDQHDAVGLLRGQPGLEIGESLDAVGEAGRRGLLALHAVRTGGIMLAEVERLGGIDPEWREQIVDASPFVVGLGHGHSRGR